MDAEITFRGKIVCITDSLPLPSIHIINKSRNVGTVSNLSGFFSILSTWNDSILITAVGFETIRFKLIPEETGMFPLLIYLSPKVYELSEFSVQPYQYRAQLRKEFIDRKLQAKIDAIDLKLPDPSYYRQFLPSNGISIFNITDFLYQFTREYKEKVRFKKILEREEMYREIDRKYNHKLLAKVSNLKDEELEEFIAFCDLEDDFIFESDEYEIIVAVLDCYERFKYCR